LFLPVITLWANLHWAFTLGLLLAAGFGLDATVSAPASERWRVLKSWLVFCVCALAAGCVTPYGYRQILETYNVLNLGIVLEQNDEWRPMNAGSDPFHEAILLILLLLALTAGAKVRFTRSLLIVCILHFGLRHVRGLPMVALSWPFMLAGPLQAQFAFLRPIADPLPLFAARGSRFLRAALSILGAVVAMILIGSIYTVVGPTVAPAANMSPKAAVDYALDHGTTGPVFNDFDFGGYLIFRGIKTFMDGRTLPFGKEFSGDYFRMGRNLSKLDGVADKYNITWTLLRPDSAFASYFDHSPAWRRLYADDTAVVHVRR